MASVTASVIDVLLYLAWIGVIVAPLVAGGVAFGVGLHQRRGKGLAPALLAAIGVYMVVHEIAEGASWFMLLALIPFLLPAEPRG